MIEEAFWKLFLFCNFLGDLERLQNFWMTGACAPESKVETRSAPLGIENFMSAFFLLIAGVVSLK